MTVKPDVVKNRGISIIWTLPIIALIICGWLVYNSYKDAGVEITISFGDASGIIPGKTRIMARGIPVGLVEKVLPDLDNQQVKTIVRMEKDVVENLVEDTLFWVVRPQLSANSIQGLETIFSGSYISIQIGTSTKPRRDFRGLSSAPPVSPETPGLHLQLTAEKLGSIQMGTGLYYRNIQIGEVQNHQLVGDKSVLIDLFIEPEFAHLVREGSRFCNVSGIQVSGKLPNLKLQVESLASLLRGGILLHTPTQFQDSPAAENGHIFTLYPDFEAANYGIPMTLTLSSGEDIVEKSTKVMYRGLEAGFVKEIQINDDEQRTVTAHILLDPRAELILRETTKFWLVKPEISSAGIHNLNLLFSGAHITFQPGSGAFKNQFNILPEPPPQTPLRKGKTFVLTSNAPNDLSAQSPVYFKNIKVGEIVDIKLEKSAETIHTTFFIYQKYLNLLSTKSVFYLHSGIEIGASIDQGLKVSTGPLANLLYGGVSFTTPDKLKKQKNFPPEEGFQFRLYSSHKDAKANDPSLVPAGKHFVIMSEDAQSVSIGAPILHKNITIGEIEGFRLTPDQQGVLIECFVYNEFKNLIHRRTRFYNSSGIHLSGGLDGIDLQAGSLRSILAGGIGCVNVSDGEPLSPATPYPLYANLQEALQADEIELAVILKENKGLKEGSPIKNKGIDVGRVTKLAFSENLQRIKATVRIHKNVSPLFRADSLIWVEQAEVNLSGVKNVESILFGSYLNILQGNGPPARTFNALPQPPHKEIAGRDGLGITLETKHLGSLSIGSPVYYRQVKIGKVTGYELSPTFQQVFVFVSISKQYSALIRKNTRFWNVSGTTIEGGIFSGLKIATASLEAFMRGGIALATPDNEKTGSAAIPGQHFTLHDKPEKQWLDWNPDIIVLEHEQAGNLTGEKE
ncbi:MAG: MlaD family protein [Desulforhopalus sp.]